MTIIQKYSAVRYLRACLLTTPLGHELEVDQALCILLAETAERRKPEATLFRDWLLDERGQR